MKRILSTTALTILGAGLVAGALALPAFAVNDTTTPDARVQQRVERMMDRFDANKDGQITTDEMTGYRTQMFQTMDVDKDGKVTAEEFANAPRPGIGKRADSDQMDQRREQNRDRMIARMDTDKDGVISLEEWNAIPHGNRMTRMDKDGDGSISREELAQAPLRHEPRNYRDCGDGPRGDMRPGMGPQDGMGPRGDTN